MNSTTSFGVWLKEQRTARHLTQEELAEHIACSAALIRKIEAGLRTPSKQTAELLAGWLQIPEAKQEEFLNFARGELSAQEAAHIFTAGSTAHSTSTPGNIPVPLTPLIGRSQEIQAVRSLLMRKEVRLLTLAGPPGIGKTRLALEVAQGVKDHFRDGAYFVALASIRDPDLVAPTIAQTVGLTSKTAESLLASLQRYLADNNELLVLDNFEQVLDASPFVLELLGACPSLQMLITSREALHVQGEQQVQVPPLETADPANLPPVEIMKEIVRSGGYPAVRLFVERAREVKPGFDLTEHNMRAVAAICARLQGLPLAIELAAARVNLLSTQEIQSRLDNSLALLESAARHLPPKQRTLRGAIDWSYELLTNEEKCLFGRLGVFVGGCTLPAVQVVCEAGGDRIRLGALAGLASLIDKSLLQREEDAYDESRFTMLELIRDYSLERLRGSGEEEEIRGLHAEYYLSFSEAGESELRGANQKLWLDRFRQEQDNIRSALRWLLNTGRGSLALELARAVYDFWFLSGLHREGRGWLEEALAAGRDAPAPVVAGALYGLASLAQQEDDHQAAVQWLEESLALYRELKDRAGISKVLSVLAFSAIRQGDLDRAIALAREALALGFDSTVTKDAARPLYMIAAAAWYQGDFAQAGEFGTRVLALGRALGDLDVISGSLTLLGLVAHYQGDYHHAEALYKESLAVARQVGSPLRVAHTIMNLGALALLQDDYSRAAPLVNEGLKSFVESNEKQGVLEGFENLGWLAAAEGQAERATHLFAAAHALRDNLQLRLPAFVWTTHEATLATIRAKLGEVAFAKAWEEGRAMSMEQAIDYALDERRSPREE